MQNCNVSKIFIHLIWISFRTHFCFIVYKHSIVDLHVPSIRDILYVRGGSLSGDTRRDRQTDGQTQVTTSLDFVAAKSHRYVATKECLLAVPCLTHAFFPFVTSAFTAVRLLS